MSDDLFAATRQANAHTTTALEAADALLAPIEPDPALVLAPREVPALVPPELAVAPRNPRGDAHRRGFKKRTERVRALKRHARHIGTPWFDDDTATP